MHLNATRDATDRRPPPRWRSLVPRLIRTLLWGDGRPSYDAFLSYSWKVDIPVATVVQSTLQQFLCPWYRLRALNVFRDLSSLPASSSLEDGLRDRLDRSQHLIVLASPEAMTSAGMEFEARYWFSRPRNGDVLVVLTSGPYRTWPELRDGALPPTLRAKLAGPPLWIDLSACRDRMLSSPNERRLRAELIDRLEQLILVFYPGHTWEALRGRERFQRQRAIGLVLLVLLAIATLTSAAYAFRQRANRALIGEQAAQQEQLRQRQIADLQTALAKEEAAKRQQAETAAAAEATAVNAAALEQNRPTVLGYAARQAVDAVEKYASPVTEEVLRATLSVLPPLLADIEAPCRPLAAAMSPSRRFVAFGADNHVCIVDLTRRALVFTAEVRDIVPNSGVRFDSAGSLLVASATLFSGVTMFHTFSGPTWSETRTRTVNAGIVRFATTADRHWIAVASADGGVAVAPWDGADEVVRSRPLIAPGVHGDISVLEFDRHDERLIVGSQSALDIWANWREHDAQRVWTQAFGPDSIPFLSAPPIAMQPDANAIAVAHDGAIEILAYDDLHKVQTILLDHVNGVSFNRQGWLIAHSSHGQFHAWWRPKSIFVPVDKMEFTTALLSGELTTAGELSTSGEGEHVFALHKESGSTTEQWASLLQITSGEELARFYHSNRIWHFYPLGAGSSGVTLGDDRVRIWGDIQPLNGRSSHEARMVLLASPRADGASAAFVTAPDGFLAPTLLELWNVPNGRVVGSREFTAGVRAVRLHGGSGTAIDVATDDGLWSLDVRDARPPTMLGSRFPAIADRCARRVALAQDAGSLALTGTAGQMWIGSPTSLHPLAASDLPRGCIDTVAISPGGETVAASFMAGPSAHTVVFDATSGRRRLTIDTPYLVRSIAFDAHGAVVAISIGMPPPSPREVGESSVQMWSVTSGARMLEQGLGIVADTTQGLCLNSDATLLGTSQGPLAQVWAVDRARGQMALRATQPLRTSMRSCRFSNDSTSVFVTDGFGARRLPLDPAAMIADAKARLGHR